MPFAVSLADRDVADEAEAIVLAQEGNKGELIEVRVTGAICGHNLRCSIANVCSHGALEVDVLSDCVTRKDTSVMKGTELLEGHEQEKFATTSKELPGRTRKAYKCGKRWCKSWLCHRFALESRAYMWSSGQQFECLH